MKYYQTGDVLYKQIEELPEKLERVLGNLVYKGQNNHHTIEGNFDLYTCNEKTYIEAYETCLLKHEEHKTISLPMGKYVIDIVLEYDHFAEESRQVID